MVHGSSPCGPTTFEKAAPCAAFSCLLDMKLEVHEQFLATAWSPESTPKSGSEPNNRNNRFTVLLRNCSQERLLGMLDAVGRDSEVQGSLDAESTPVTFSHICDRPTIRALWGWSHLQCFVRFGHCPHRSTSAFRKQKQPRSANRTTIGHRTWMQFRYSHSLTPD